MAETVIQLQAQLDALKKARNSGVLMVRHGDTSTQFRSLSEMNQVITAIQRQIDLLSGVKRPRVNYIRQTSKGYGSRLFDERFWNK